MQLQKVYYFDKRGQKRRTPPKRGCPKVKNIEIMTLENNRIVHSYFLCKCAKAPLDFYLRQEGYKCPIR